LAEPRTALIRSDTPALDWEREALPIGNGRLGAMILGAAGATRLALNVASLWTGDANPSGAYDDDGFGNYQALGSLLVELDPPEGGDRAVQRYERTLDLARAVHRIDVRWADGSLLEEQAFASHPDGVLALRLRAEAGISGWIRLAGTRGEASTAGERQLGFAGTLPNGLRHAALLGVEADGEVEASGDSLRFARCRSVTVYFTADTSYALRAATEFRGPDPEPLLPAILERAAGLGWERLLERHVADHSALFGRASVDLGASAPELGALPHAARVARYASGADPELLATLFDYGRYLLIACSRPGGLPANLQGLWNESNHPPWHADYHTNINVQMCYWAAEPTALSECHRPLFDLLDELKAACAVATRSAFGPEVPGFTYRTSHNIFGGQGWEWNLPASAWYALHYLEHFAFTRDRAFLRERTLPYLRSASEFWLHRLQRRADGALVAPGGWSPEHGPVEDGVTYDQTLVHELFTALLDAAQELGQDDPLVQRVRAARADLLGPRIGRFGQLQEWASDRDDPADRHRHTSHLIGMYPGRSVSTLGTPELARAAAVSLRARGDTDDSRRSWTWPWRALLWARLGSPRDCQRMLDGYVSHNLLPNLIATHPPLQLDGSLCFPACIAEMLLQSHTGVIELLPAVDRERWPRGSFHGLRARGGFEVSGRWEPQGVVEASLLSLAGRPVTVRSEPAPRRVEDERGHTVAASADGTPLVAFETERNQRYRLRFD
jgi:alpha-L-fucosidase 2